MERRTLPLKEREILMQALTSGPNEMPHIMEKIQHGAELMEILAIEGERGRKMEQ